MISEKEAILKQKEIQLESRQKELEQRADDINKILKLFGHDNKSIISA